MTFGIDVSGQQLTLDIASAKDDEFVIVKAVAAYKPEHTVADGYQSNIDRTIAAGKPKGHYLVPNSRNTPKQSAAFLAANVYRPAQGDVYMLDNEPLDGYATHWRDDQVMEFFEEFVRLTGVPWSQLWLYCPAALTRQTGPWTRVEQARKAGLKILWVSYGDNDPLREDGEEPLLGGGITGWDVHQFTSTYRIPGYGGNVDRNYTPRPVTDFFGRSEMGYSNVNNFIVILADNRDPYVSWANHLARGSAGGVDCVAAIGTPIYAPDDCYLANTPNNGTGGNTITLSFANGWRDQMMHLSRFVTAGSKRKGELVGYSGDSAAPGQPHVHWHRIDPSGARRNPWDYFTTSGIAGGEVTPIEETPEPIEYEDDMPIYFRRQATGTVAVFGASFRTTKGGTTGRHEFATPTEYAAWRGALVTTNLEVDRLNGDERLKQPVPPAELSQIVGLDEVGWATVCAVYGV